MYCSFGDGKSTRNRCYNTYHMELLILFGIACITFFTRIFHLLNVPIFTDEAIYIRWAQIGLSDPAHRFISLTDGKQPLLTWLMYPMLKIFPDPLFAGRFISVLAGVGSVLAIYVLGRELFGRRTALVASLLYIFSPFTVVYDRLALMDSLLAMFGLWSLYLEILLVRRLRLDVALLLGFSLGFGLLTKSSAYFYLYFLPFTLLFFRFDKKGSGKHLLTYVGLSTISVTIGIGMYNLLRLSPWFYIIEQKNYSFIYTFGEFLQSPFQFFWHNLYGLLQIFVLYLTMPLVLLLTGAIVWGVARFDRRIVLLFLWFLFPFLALAMFGKVIFPRFILFMIIPLFIIIAHTIVQLSLYLRKRLLLFLCIVFLVLSLPVYQSILALSAPVEMNIPRADRNQLFDDWPSGYGVQEVVNFLDEQSQNGKVVIGTEGTFGLFPAAFEIYLGTNPNVEIHGYWPVSEVPKELIEKAHQFPTYLVFKESQSIPSNWPLTLRARYQRGKGKTFLLLYEVIAPKV